MSKFTHTRTPELLCSCRLDVIDESDQSEPVWMPASDSLLRALLVWTVHLSRPSGPPADTPQAELWSHDLSLDGH